MTDVVMSEEIVNTEVPAVKEEAVKEEIPETPAVDEPIPEDNDSTAEDQKLTNGDASVVRIFLNIYFRIYYFSGKG